MAKDQKNDDWEITLGPSGHESIVKFNGKIVKNVGRIRVDVSAGGLTRVHLDLIAVGNIKVKPNEVILPTGIERKGKWD